MDAKALLEKLERKALSWRGEYENCGITRGDGSSSMSAKDVQIIETRVRWLREEIERHNEAVRRIADAVAEREANWQ